jgi:Yip1 domain
MTLVDRMVALAKLTLQDPRQAARALLAEGIPMPARTAGLLLVAVLSALLTSLQFRNGAADLDPVTALILASPFRAAVVQWLFLALSVFLIHRVGRAAGGTGSLPDALLIVVWLQILMLGLQLLQLAVSFVSPPLGGIIGLASFALFFWLMTAFIAELHGFASRGAVFAGMLATMLATGFVIGFAVMLIIGPEALVANV